MPQPATKIRCVKKAVKTGSKDKDKTGLEIIYRGENTDEIYKKCCKKDIFVYSYKTFFGYIHILALLSVLLKLLEVEGEELPTHRL